MSSLDRYRPPREGYQPPSLPPKPPQRRPSKSPTRRREIPPAAPSPPTHSSRTSPPRPHSRKSAPSPALSSPLTPTRPRGQQWRFTKDEVLSTPSTLHGLSPSDEAVRRAKGVNFIYQVGVLVQPHPLPQLTLYVAAVFFHRFFMRQSMVEEKGGIHHYNIAATAVFLANKTEENCFKTKNLIIAVAKVAQKNKDLIIDEQSKEYWRWRDSILAHEELMLEILTFDLMVTNPYEQLYSILHKLELVHEKPLRESAWAFCNDTAMTSIPLLMGATDIAMAALYFASIASKTPISDVDGEAWWKHLRADEKMLVTAINEMSDTYTDHPLKKSDMRIAGSPEFTLENTRRRGETMLSQTEMGSSRAATPMDADRMPQSPRSKANGRSDAGSITMDEDNIRGMSAEVRAARGDSDAALKAVANNLDVHKGKPNGHGLLSPGKRKSQNAEGDSDGERELKRARRSEEDT